MVEGALKLEVINIGTPENLMYDLEWHWADLIAFVNGREITEAFLITQADLEKALSSYLKKAYSMGFKDGEKGHLHAPQWAKFIEDWNKENLEKETK